MSLASFFESIPEKQRNLQLGLECDNPMSGAFPHKRVVTCRSQWYPRFSKRNTSRLGFVNEWHS